MINKSKMRSIMAGALFCAAGIVTAQAANSSIVTFSVDMSTNVVLGSFIPGTDTVSARGTFNGYGTLNLVQDTTQLPEYIYTNTVNDTTDANGTTLQYKYFNSNGSVWENTADGQNRAALLPSTSGASLVLPTAFFGDSGTPVTQTVVFKVDVSEQVVLGNFVPGTSSVEVRGTFNSWAGGATPLVNDTATTVPGEPGNPIWTNTATMSYSPGAALAFKYVIQPGTVWDSPSAANQNGGQNRYFAAVSQTLPLVNFSDSVYVPATTTNIMSVNMAGPAAYDASFNPSSVTLNGQFNGWGAAIPMTNNPASATPQVYTTTQPVVYGQGGSFQYQYRYANAGGTVYDHFNGLNGGGGNRSLTEPNQNNYTVPTVNFNDAGFDDYLSQPVNVTFEIVMKTGDVGNLGHPTWAPGTAVFVNGVFNNWANWDPITLAPYQLVEYPINGSSSLYSNQFTIPAGNLTSTIYKYGMIDGGNTLDNEAGSGANVLRVIRTTGPGAGGAYVFSVDSWANMYQEPSFGQLTIDKPNIDGLVPISWLGRPSVQVQSSPSLTSPTWTSYKITDGTNWVNGVSSTNGLVSKWADIPGGQSQKFYRLIKN